MTVVESSPPSELDVTVAVSAGLLTVPDAVTAVIAAPALENEPVASKKRVRNS